MVETVRGGRAGHERASSAVCASEAVAAPAARTAGSAAGRAASGGPRRGGRGAQGGADRGQFPASSAGRREVVVALQQDPGGTTRGEFGQQVEDGRVTGWACVSCQTPSRSMPPATWT